MTQSAELLTSDASDMPSAEAQSEAADLAEAGDSADAEALSDEKDDEALRRKKKTLRKLNDLVTPRVSRGGSLTLLCRKVFNVMLYHVQRQGRPGVDAPLAESAEDEADYKKYYWLPLSELVKDAAFNSEDTALIKETLLKLQDIRLVVDTNTKFKSEILINGICIISGGRGGRTMVGWQLHETLETLLHSPPGKEFHYTRLSLLYLTSFRSTAAIALYEICKRYQTSPKGKTEEMPWEWWYEFLTGNPVSTEKPQYKYFKRDTLKPAMAEVLTTDVSFTLEEVKNGRRVVGLYFKFSGQSKLPLTTAPEPVIDTNLLNRIVSLGFSARDAEDILAQHELDMLTRTVDLVEKRMRDMNQPKLNSPAAYLRTALAHRYVDAEVQKRAAPPKPALAAPKPKKPEITSEQMQERAARAEALDAFDALPLEAKGEKFEVFLSEHPALRASARKRPDGHVVRKALADWLVKTQSN